MLSRGTVADRVVAQAPPARRPRPPWGLAAASGAVALALLLPLAFLLLEAQQAGWAKLSSLLFRHLTLTLLWNTVRLSVVVTAACAVLGVATAWFVERTDLPGRRIWAVLVVLPVAIPDFVVGFGWVSIAPSVHGYWGAVLVMTLAVYPLVYLPVAASLRGADPAQEEVARSLGMGRLRTFFGVTLGQVRPALLGGCLLVALALLAEYGAFEILRFQTFTTEIFTEFRVGFDTPAAGALSLVLVLLGLAVLGGEAGMRGGRTARVGPQVQRIQTRRRLGRATFPVLLGFAALAGLALGIPVATIVFWLLAGGASTLPAASLASAALHTAWYSAAAGAIATVLATPVALLAVRRPSRISFVLERSTYVVQALPGVVVGLALVYFTVRYASVVYQSSALLVFAYTVLFFPLALVAVRASVVQAPPQLEEVARSLGIGRWGALVRVTVPLIAPGLAAAFCLVFLSAVTELTATLILVPTGVQTLSTQFWAYTTNLSYGAAAPYAALMIGIAALPSYVLGRYFDRLPGRRAGP
jgi:iron(III) transport system permease protein